MNSINLLQGVAGYRAAPGGCFHRRLVASQTARWVKTIAVCWIALGSATDAWAQLPGAVQGGLDAVQVSGTLQAISGNQVKIEDEQSHQSFGVLGNETQVTYLGEADKSVLQPGVFVRFTAPFDAAGKPQAELQEIEIFQATQRRRMSRQERQDQMPGIYPVEEPEANQSRQPAKKAPDPASERSPAIKTVRVVGQLKFAKQGKLQVMVGARSIVVTLAEDGIVKVASSDLSLAVQGDAVEISGLRNAAQPDWIQVQKMTVTGVQPLGATPNAKQDLEATKEEQPKKRVRRSRSRLAEPAQSPTSKPQ
ncbi:hypothetical protein [Aureliella helgolandensis]|uniref:Uncharacterized protein n=1 Tax=Aureliella helgolandensis TaxID=2527968 RepID=A0A518GHE0_9BACT|nr:hypothetical protein [Aureliella helgolandensis]QDV28012.1 hypothetical protein Q31a_64050 [Aureliella helgolandensis]